MLVFLILDALKHVNLVLSSSSLTHCSHYVVLTGNNNNIINKTTTAFGEWVVMMMTMNCSWYI